MIEDFDEEWNRLFSDRVIGMYLLSCALSSKYADDLRSGRAKYPAYHLMNMASHRRRRYREKQNGGKHTRGDIEKKFKEQGGCCAVCRANLAAGFHKDHIVPVALGGSSDPENIQLLCPWCNRSKGAKVIECDVYQKT